MLGVRDPRRHALFHGLAIDGAGAPTVAHAAQAVAKAAHVLLGPSA
jgi:hypothetical protein